MRMRMMMKIVPLAMSLYAAFGQHGVDAQMSEPVNYTHAGVELQGFLAVPENKTMAPAVVIIPDWDGVNEYEIRRAVLVASDLGYVGFAADIYGKDLHTVENITQRRELATLYRTNATLFSERIQAAVDLVRTFEAVDSDNVAIAGYCFGGTGVLTYAMTGINDVKAVVSFHGGLGSVPGAGPEVEPKVLILSGGDDDSSTDIMDLEMTLDSANATWEITRYSGIEHAFTVWSDDRYNEVADMRSWNSMRTFLLECFDEIEFEPTGPMGVAVESVNYTDVDGTELLSYLALPSTEWQRPLPTVVIIPDWDGNNLYEQQRATVLAQLGYVGFAADIFGADLQENLPIEQRRAQTTLYRSNSTLFVQRMERAIEEVKKYEDVDPDNIAVIGYCFGGTGIIELAFSGNQDVKAVVSFHGGLTSLPSPDTNVSPFTLILSGGDDDAHGNQTELEAALNGGEADWEITRYSGVVHGFTSWTAETAYSLVADYRSWESMLTAFAELMPVPMMAVEAPASAPVDAPTSAPVEGTTTAAPVDAPTSAPLAPTSAPVDAPTSAPVDAMTSAPVDAPTSAPVEGTSGAAGLALAAVSSTAVSFLASWMLV